MSSKEQLRQRLREKIAARQAIRGGNKTSQKYLDNRRAKQIKSTPTLKCNNNEDIFNCTKALKADVDFLTKKGVNNAVAMNNALGEKYDWLKKHYFAIYKATVSGHMNMNMLKMMLAQKTKIDNKEVEAKEASMKVGSMLAEKYNVDVSKLVAEAKAKQEAGEEKVNN